MFEMANCRIGRATLIQHNVVVMFRKKVYHYNLKDDHYFQLGHLVVIFKDQSSDSTDFV